MQGARSMTDELTNDHNHNMYSPANCWACTLVFVNLGKKLEYWLTQLHCQKLQKCMKSSTTVSVLMDKRNCSVRYCVGWSVCPSVGPRIGASCLL